MNLFDIQTVGDALLAMRDASVARLRNRRENTEEWVRRCSASEEWHDANELDLDSFDFKFCGDSGRFSGDP